MLLLSNIKLLWKLKNQIMAVFCANIGVFASGCSIGWLSPALIILQSNHTSPLNAGAINVDEASWLGSLLNVGGVFGVLFLSWFGCNFGGKMALCLSAIPLILSWILIIFGRHIFSLYLSQFAVGFTFGGQYVLIPLFVTEISDERIRGILGSFLTLLLYLGILVSFIIGTFVPFHLVPYIMLSFPIIFLLCMVFFVPESPQFLMSIDNNEKIAELSIRYYKKYLMDSMDKNYQLLQIEMNRLKDNMAERRQKTSLKQLLSDFYTNHEATNGLLIGLALMTLFTFNGTFIFLAYASNIFSASDTNFDENISSIIIAAIQLLGSIVSLFLVDTIGRRILLIVSSIGCTVGLMAMGAHNYFVVNKINVSDWYWVPVTSLSLTYFFACIGLMPLGFIITAEVLPGNLRSFGTTFCLVYLNGLLFVVTKAFPLMAEAFHLYVCMWIFAAFCFVGIFFSVIIVKETKGKKVN